MFKFEGVIGTVVGEMINWDLAAPVTVYALNKEKASEKTLKMLGADSDGVFELRWTNIEEVWEG